MNDNKERYKLFGKVIGYARAENISTVTLTAIGNAGHIMYKREGYTADQIVERKEMDQLQKVLEELAFPRYYKEPTNGVPVIAVITGDYGRTRHKIDVLVQDISATEQEKTVQLRLQYK